MQMKSKGVQTPMMFEYEYDETEIADEVIRSIEKEYGRSIVRIPIFERNEKELNCFDIMIIFTDFKLFEGTIRVVPLFDMATVRVSGTYY